MADPYNRGPGNLNKPYVNPTDDWKSVIFNVGKDYAERYFNKKFGPRPQQHPNPNPMGTKVGGRPAAQSSNRVNWDNPAPGTPPSDEREDDSNKYLYWLIGGVLFILLAFGMRK